MTDTAMTTVIGFRSVFDKKEFDKAHEQFLLRLKESNARIRRGCQGKTLDDVLHEILQNTERETEGALKEGRIHSAALHNKIRPEEERYRTRRIGVTVGAACIVCIGAIVGYAATYALTSATLPSLVGAVVGVSIGKVLSDLALRRYLPQQDPVYQRLLELSKYNIMDKQREYGDKDLVLGYSITYEPERVDHWNTPLLFTEVLKLKDPQRKSLLDVTVENGVPTRITVGDKVSHSISAIPTTIAFMVPLQIPSEVLQTYQKYVERYGRLEKK